MPDSFSGRYPIEHRAGEIERLHLQSAAFARDVEVMLDLIGVREGWSCADLGCGPGGLTEPLSRRGGAVHLGQRLYHLARQMGLAEVRYRPVLIGVRSTDPMVDYLPATAESLRVTITRLGLMLDGEFPKILAETRQHLQKPETVF